MRAAVVNSFTFAVVLLVSSPLMANQAPEKDKLKKPSPKQPSVIQIPKELILDAQQQEAVAALNAEYLPKLEELKKQQADVLTPDQKQAIIDAKNSAKDSGKDKTELAKLIRDAVQLTNEQIQQQVEHKKKMGELNQEIRDRFVKLLTTEQQEILKQAKNEVTKTSGKTAGEKKPDGASEKPDNKKPNIDKSAEKKPANEKPSAKQPTSEKPAAKSTTGEKPIDKKPANEKPTAKQPTSEKPAVKSPTGGKPIDKKPAGKEAKEKKADAEEKVPSPKSKDQSAKKPADKQ